MKKILMALIAGLFVVGFSSLAFGQNLLSNPGFESWTVNGVGGPPDNWSLSGSSMTAEKDSTTIHGGSYSTKVTWTTTSTRYLQQYVPITAGSDYEFSFWVLDNDAGGRARVCIRWYTGTTFISGYYGGYTSDSPDWQTLSSGVQTAPAGADTAHVEIRVYDISGWPGTATIYVDDTNFEIPTTATIEKAYSVSSTAVDVLYGVNISSVDPADYSLTGTATITFSSATIDGTNAKLVHLTGASTSMTGDTTVDNIADTANSTDYDFYAGIMPIANTNTNNPGGHIDNTHYATFTGIVSAIGSNRVWISDATGAYNGVLIYDYDFDGLVAVGDEILFTAIRDVYSNLTELKTPTLLSTISSGSDPYGPTLINGSDIDENLAADTNPGESWEGQLVKINNCYVDSSGNYYYRCTDDNGTTYFYVGDNVDYHFNNITLNVGSTYNITGVVDWYNSGPYYRINPRTQDDIFLVGDTDPPEISNVIATNDTTVIVTFNENVEETTAETISNYTITSRNVTVTNAKRDDTNHSKVTLTVSGMTEGNYTLTVDNVEDLSGNPMDNVSEPFSYYPPPAIVINEVDADNPGTDTLEFIELYDGGVGNTALDGLVVVLFNGSDDKSYLPAIDLDGYSTDGNGYFVIGCSGVANVDLIFANPSNNIQNGADAVALYSGDDTNFPNDTPVTTDNLIDAIVYDTNDNDDPGLLVLLNSGQPQVNEDDKGDKDHHSNQRIPNGSGGARNTDTYSQGIPTPGAENEVQSPTPQNVTIQISGNDVVLTWSPGAKTTYNIYRSTNPYSNFIKIDSLITDTTYTDYGAANDTKYFYYITGE